MGQGKDLLYLYIEARAEWLVFNDRAGQDGDGCAMVIAKSLPDGATTEEFYELAHSTANNPARDWS